MKVIVSVLVVGFALFVGYTAADGETFDCNGGECGGECAGNSCQEVPSCGSSCQPAPSCGNECYSNLCGRHCTSNCGGCMTRMCVQTCRSRCNQCASRCRTSCQQSKEVGEKIRTQEKVVDRELIERAADIKNDANNNITAVFELKTEVNNNNSIHIPVEYVFNHHTNVSVVPSAPPSISINVTTGTSSEPKVITIPSTNPTTTTTTHSEICCYVLGQKYCDTKDEKPVNCTQALVKTCGEQCRHQPMVINLPIGGYQTNSVTQYKHIYVPIPQPIPVPQPMPVPHPVPVPQPVHVPVHIPRPYPVLQQVPVPQPVSVPQPVPVPYPIVQRQIETVPQYIPVATQPQTPCTAGFGIQGGCQAATQQIINTGAIWGQTATTGGCRVIGQYPFTQCSSGPQIFQGGQFMPGI